MTKKSKSSPESSNDYRPVGYVFLAIAFGMLLSETTRAFAIAFFAIGVAFIVVKHDDGDSKHKPAKK